jgi:AcrR family transcriptional regulator
MKAAKTIDPADPTKPKKMRRKPERPGEILAAAFEEFVLHGYAAARLEDVAARAGVTKGTIYFHFESKENVFVQMVRELSKPTLMAMQEFLSRETPDIVAFLNDFVDFSHDLVLKDRYAREILRLLIAEASRFPDLVDEHTSEFLDPICDHLQARLVQAAKEGTIRRSPVIDFPDLLLAPPLVLNIFVLLFADRQDAEATARVAAAKDLLLNGLLPRG